MKNKIICPKCRSEKRVKSGFNKKTAIFVQKNAVATTPKDSADIQNMSDEKQYSCIWKKMDSEKLKGFLRCLCFCHELSEKAGAKLEKCS